MTANTSSTTQVVGQAFASASSAWSYDAIAEVYATDMGQSMPFDDVGWYRALCLLERGASPDCAVLELGCGTGRILIDLLRAGVDACGADRSLPMLKRLRGDAIAHGLVPRVVQMDIARPAFAGLRAPFDVILLPYSLITYLREPAAAADAVAAIAALLCAGGCLALDAFVPQPVTSFADFRLDYQRPHASGTLERHKRITAHADGSNRIERRYRVFDTGGSVREEFSTDETIRPYHAEDLVRFGAAAGLHREALSWDYGQRVDAEGARFATVVLRRPG
ncbi:MAG: methyltransferase domain-containing protein [Rudaea sp.]